MDNENKPNQTDPSAVAKDFYPSEQYEKEEIVAARVQEATSSGKAQSNPAAQPTQAQASGGAGSDVSVQKDSSSVADPNTEALKLIEASTGRKFSSAEEAQKYLSNLNSLVGDQSVAKAREAAKLYDALMAKMAEQNGQTAEEVKKFWADELIKADLPKKPEPKQAPAPAEPVRTEDPRVSELSKQLAAVKENQERDQLLRKYPEAAEILEEISVLANSKGISHVEAFEKSPFKSLLEAKTREESAKSPVVTSSNRIGIDVKKVQEKASKVIASGTEDSKIDLVKQFGKAVGLD